MSNGQNGWNEDFPIQDILPNATARELVDEVKKRIAIWAPGGGYVFCAAHNIQVDVPAENAVAMLQAGKDFPVRSHDIGNLVRFGSECLRRWWKSPTRT